VNSSSPRATVHLHELAAPQPISTVVFDFHSTLVDQGSSLEWISCANDLLAELAGEELVPVEAAAYLDRVWEHARAVDPTTERDRSTEAHKAVFNRVMSRLPGITDVMTDALYSTLTGTWHAYVDAAPVLRELREAGVRLVILSNTGIDIRPTLEREGLLALADAVVLSYEVGHVKPDPVIFHVALDSVGATPSTALMVGDSANEDNGAANLGIRTLILPRTLGVEHGLDLVPALVSVSSARARA